MELSYHQPFYIHIYIHTHLRFFSFIVTQNYLFHFLSPEAKGDCHSWACLQNRSEVIFPYHSVGVYDGFLFCFEPGLFKREKNMAETPQKLAVGFRCNSNNQSIFFKAFGLHGLVMEMKVCCQINHRWWSITILVLPWNQRADFPEVLLRIRRDKTDVHRCRLIGVSLACIMTHKGWTGIVKNVFVWSWWQCGCMQ